MLRAALRCQKRLIVLSREGFHKQPFLDPIMDMLFAVLCARYIISITHVHTRQVKLIGEADAVRCCISKQGLSLE